jgi:hypothetical protein
VTTAILWYALTIGFLGLIVATICGMIYFVWSIVSGRWPDMDNQFEEGQKAARPAIKADLDEVNDPTVWLPEFAKKTRVELVTHSRGGWSALSRARYSHTVRVEVNQKSEEQLDEEKRVYFAAKEKK